MVRRIPRVNSEEATARERDIRSVLGSNIRALRKELCLTQQQVAFMASMDRSCLSRIECGGYNPTLSELIRIADSFDVSLAVLLSPWERL